MHLYPNFYSILSINNKINLKKKLKRCISLVVSWQICRPDAGEHCTRRLSVSQMQRVHIPAVEFSIARCRSPQEKARECFMVTRGPRSIAGMAQICLYLINSAFMELALKTEI